MRNFFSAHLVNKLTLLCFVTVMSLAHTMRRGLTCLRTSAQFGSMSCRHMASNRNHPVEGGSNQTGITEEVRDLIRNMKSAENLEEWKVDSSLGPKVAVDTWSPNKVEDVDNDQETDMVYWPHRGKTNFFILI